jgi:hypothetical protein
MPKEVKNDITGKRFGYLVALRFIPTEGRHARFLFRCDCGTEKEILAQSVIAGLTVSCGCYHRKAAAKRARTHGHSGKARTPTYSSWAAMMDRGVWGGHPSYAQYGAKGIGVHERWHTFENFLADMGERPKGTSLDRIDNTKGYGPGNCRWATRREQALNTSRTVKVVYKGSPVSVFELCEQLGLSYGAISSRANRRGRDFVKALRSVGVECEPCCATPSAQSMA